MYEKTAESPTPFNLSYLCNGFKHVLLEKELSGGDDVQVNWPALWEKIAEFYNNQANWDEVRSIRVAEGKFELPPFDMPLYSMSKSIFFCLL